ncbi:MAG: hypothetical protein KIS87_05975 [Phycisphaeraceae bacterium]|nr:hypothetical protein [Phycisphaeraceae bacterium]
MRETEFRFQFTPDVNLAEADGTLRLSLLATEGLHGEARVRTEVTFAVDPVRAEIRVAGGGIVTEHVVQIYTALLTHEFGREAFTVRRDSRQPAAAAVA